MHLKNSLYFTAILFSNFLFLSSLSSLDVAPLSLPTLITKQDLNNLRFIDKDGLFTYYQNRQGDLLLSTNFKVLTPLKGEAGDNYTLLGSMAQKKIIISLEKNYRNNNQWDHLPLLKLINFGGHQTLMDLGQGMNPKLHLEDTWASFFQPRSNSLIFQPFAQMSQKFSFFLENQANPYFIPEVVMVTEHDILYTDINKEGHSVIMLYNRRDHSKTLLIKQAKKGVKIELCLNKSLLYIGQFGLSDVPFGGQIEYLNLEQTKDFSKTTILYQSPTNDYGNINCDREEGRLYFIKNLSPGPGSFVTETELASLQIKNKTVQILSDLDYVTQFISMDGRLLIPFQGKIYLAVGENNLIDKDNLHKAKGQAPSKDSQKDSSPGLEEGLDDLDS